MSKFLNVPNGNYYISVQDGGRITLDTGTDEFGAPVGEVRITGNLTVQGETTTVKSTITTIADNIITVNAGETGGSGITLDTAGIMIDRGQAGGGLSNAYIVFDENVVWRDPNTETMITGGFVFKNDSGSLVGIRSNSISTGGGDLYLINTGSGVISVTGTTNYEDNVTDDDHVPNKLYVDNAIDTAFATVFLRQIGDGTETISSITIDDEETTGLNSVITFSVDGQVVSNLYADRWEFDEIRIAGTTIETLSSNEDLILRAAGAGSVKIEDTLHITSVPDLDDIVSLNPLLPTAPTNGAKIYISDQYSGKTGIYFINAENNRDELVSKNRALLFSMLF